MNNVLAQIIHILFIQLSIFAFILPFYGYYRYTHYRDKKVQVSLSQHIEYFFSSKSANYLVFFWALTESIFWFVIPEFLLLLMVFMRIKNKKQMLLYDIYGTAAGIIIAINLHLSHSSVLNLPYIKEGMIDQVNVWFQSLGVWALFYQPFSGVPFKVFNHMVSNFHIMIIPYVLLAIAVRVGRYAIFYFVLTGMYPYLHRFVYKNYLKLLIVSSFIFALLLYRVYQSFGPDYVIFPGY